MIDRAVMRQYWQGEGGRVLTHPPRGWATTSTYSFSMSVCLIHRDLFPVMALFPGLERFRRNLVEGRGRCRDAWYILRHGRGYRYDP